MLSALAVSGYVLPPPALVGEKKLRGSFPTGDMYARLAELAEAQARARTRLKEQRDRFDQLSEQAEHPEVDPDDLDALARALRAEEIEHAALLVPQIERLNQNLASPKGRADTPSARSWRRLAEESLEIAISWLELYQNQQIRLYKLASDRRSVDEPSSPVFSDPEAAAEYLRKLIAE